MLKPQKVYPNQNDEQCPNFKLKKQNNVKIENIVKLNFFRCNQFKACRGQIDKSEVKLFRRYLDVLICKIIAS